MTIEKEKKGSAPVKINPGSLYNRHERRRIAKFTKQKMMPGVQDSAEATLQVYWIPMKRKSRAGVEYTYYKKVVDKIGLKKNGKDK